MPPSGGHRGLLTTPVDQELYCAARRGRRSPMRAAALQEWRLKLDLLTICFATDATLEWRIEPHAEFVERESRAETIQQRDPEGRTVALEDQCKVSGYRENEDAVHIMMDVHSGNGFPVHSRQNETEKPRADCGQNKCGGNSGRGNSGFWKKHTPESISGGPASRFVTRAPNDLNDSERRAEHRRSEKEVRDIFKSIRLEPSDDLPSVEKRQDAF